MQVVSSSHSAALQHPASDVLLCPIGAAIDHFLFAGRRHDLLTVHARWLQLLETSFHLHRQPKFLELAASHPRSLQSGRGLVVTAAQITLVRTCVVQVRLA